ncbi:Leucine rich repeat protein [Spraguea lophii 42_110]|uniref:Leucine rich repeat protein n=1 Tax=Spraguea lophii (strain 42_110) TaxID=1358809 RepID=S7XPB1_SPRLO|nr:Leucine rich repeat protein [Spraguea lophii 42_110]
MIFFFFIISFKCANIATDLEKNMWRFLMDDITILYGENNKYIAELRSIDAIYTVYQDDMKLVIRFKNNKNYIPSIVCECHKMKSFISHNGELTQLPDNFNKLKKLEFLDLGNNEFTEIPHQIFFLENLDYLNLSENLITTIPSNIKLLSKLTTLLLSKNKLVEISDDIGILSNLELLDLSSNYELFTDLNIKRRSLKFTRFIDFLKYTNIKQLHLISCKLEKLPSDFVFPYLTNLHLNHNFLYKLPMALSKCYSLEQLDLSFNFFSDIQLPIIKNLPIIELCFNKNKISGRVMINCEKLIDLKILYLNNNYISVFEFQKCCKREIDELHLKDNLIKKLGINIYEMETLKVLDLSKNNIIKIKDFTCCTLNFLTIKIKVNKLRTLKNIFLFTNIAFLEVECSEKCGDMAFLDLFQHQEEDGFCFEIVFNNCYLTEIPYNLDNCKGLEKLTIKNNNINKISNVFYNTKNLKHLCMINNKTEYVEGSIFLHRNFEIIDLRNNLLRYLPSQINNINKELTVILYKNPIIHYGKEEKVGLMNLNYKIVANIEIYVKEDIPEEFNNLHGFFSQKFSRGETFWNIDKLSKIVSKTPKKHTLLGEEILNIWKNQLKKYVVDSDIKKLVKIYLYNLYNIPYKREHMVKSIPEEDKNKIKDYIEEIFHILLNKKQTDDLIIETTFEYIEPGLKACLDGQFEHISRAYYTLAYNIEDPDIFYYVKDIISRLKYDILMYITTSNDFHQNVHILSYWRKKFAEELGFTSYSSIYGIQIENSLLRSSEYILYQFFKKFSIRNVVEKITKEINSSNHLICLATIFIYKEKIDEELKKQMIKYDDFENQFFTGITEMGTKYILNLLCLFTHNNQELNHKNKMNTYME